ncbi:hypothetical protein [Microbulbifer sp. TYP-18]|uniref:hypothetical protein n=1 Tax=Microbulbifer sp. TYP-18 TaxID=3230024 RepID=UPI0034C62503
MEGGLNTYGYVFQSPVMKTDPTGLVCGTGACVGIAIDIGRGVKIGYRGYRSYQAARALQGIVSGLNDCTEEDGVTFPWPPKMPGKYTCICRAQDLNGKEGCFPKFGCGFGVANDARTARNMAENMARAKVGGSDHHHTQCECTGPKGDHL